MNDNPKNNMLMSEKLRQNTLTILEYFDVGNDDIDDKYMHRNIPELLAFFV